MSPLVCQTLIASGVPWFQFYYGSLVLSAINILFLSVAFKPTQQERLSERREVITVRHSEAKKLRSGRSSPVLDDEKTLPSHSSFEASPSRNSKWHLYLAWTSSHLTIQPFVSHCLCPTSGLSRSSLFFIAEGTSNFNRSYLVGADIFRSETVTQGFVRFYSIFGLDNFNWTTSQMVTYLLERRVSPPFILSLYRWLIYPTKACKSKNYWICHLRFLGRHQPWTLLVGIFHSIVRGLV